MCGVERGHKEGRVYELGIDTVEITSVTETYVGFSTPIISKQRLVHPPRREAFHPRVQRINRNDAYPQPIIATVSQQCDPCRSCRIRDRCGVVTRKTALPVANRRASPSLIPFRPARTRASGLAFAKRISPRRQLVAAP